jgi:hypothetical protein
MRRLANKPLLGGWIVFGSSLLGRSKRARKRAFVGLGRFSRPLSAWRPPAKFSMLDTILASPERIASIIFHTQKILDLRPQGCKMIEN